MTNSNIRTISNPVEAEVEDQFDYSKYALGALLNTLGRLVYARTKTALSDVGYPPEYIGVLWVVNDMPGLSQSTYADIQFRDVTTFGRIVDRLVNHGHMTRTELTDRRAKGLSITTSGKNILKASLPIVHDVEEDILTRLSRKDQQQLFTLLDQVLSDLRAKGIE